MTRLLAVALLLALAACDRKPVAGSVDDKSAQGDSVRRAANTVDAANDEAKAAAVSVVPAATSPAANP